MIAWLRRVRQRALRSEFLLNIARLGGGTALAQAMVLVATPAITRLYRPVDIGLVGLFTAFLTFASTVASLRYELAVGVAPPQDRDLLALLSCWLTVPVGLLSGIVLVVLIHTNTPGFGALPYWSGLAAVLLVVVTGVFAALRFWYVAHKDFASIAAALVRQGFGRALLPVLTAPLGWGWGGLLAGEAAGRMLGFGRLARTALPALVSASSRGLRGMRECVVRYRQFPLTFLPSVLMDAVTSVLPLPMVAGLFGVSTAGLFALAQRVMLLPGALICSSLADVYQGRFVDAARVDPASVQRQVTSGCVRLFGLAAAVYVPVSALALTAFPLIFGPQWTQAGTAAAALAPLAVSGVVTNPLSRAMLLSKWPQLKLIADVFRMGLPAAGLYCGHLLGWSFVSVILLYALLGLLADAVYLGVIWYSVAPVRQRAYG